MEQEVSLTEVERILITVDAMDLVMELREMCIEREARLDGEVPTDYVALRLLGDEIDKELAERVFGKKK